MRLDRTILCIGLSCFYLGTMVHYTHTKDVYLRPGSFSTIVDKHFDKKCPFYREGYANFLLKCHEGCAKLGHRLHFIVRPGDLEGLPPPDTLVFFDIPGQNDAIMMETFHMATRTILFAWEPPTIAPSNFNNFHVHALFDKIYTLWDEVVDQIKYFKFYEPQVSVKLSHELPTFGERRLCTIMTSPKTSPHPRELYSARISAMERFTKIAPGSIEMWGAYGQIMTSGENLSKVVSSFFVGQIYRGAISSKRECYKNYRFAICYENMRGLPGYVTSEKFMFCLLSGCIPIYWGADNITDYLPPDCFIDRRNFPSDTELYNYLASLSESEYKWYVGNAQKFVGSQLVSIFSHDNFIDIFLDAIEPGYDRSIVFTPEELSELWHAKEVMQMLGHLIPPEYEA